MVLYAAAFLNLKTFRDIVTVAGKIGDIVAPVS